MRELLNKDIEKICKKYRLMGANVALFDEEQIIYSYNYGYANKGQKIKSTNDSLYMIGSNTKVLTAICILKLMEEGVLSLEDDIRKFIPEFQVKSTFDYDKITIANLLMHRSGLVGDMYHLILDRNGDFHDVIKELKHTYLTAMPGTMFAYSNVGYTVLGIIIERASGLSYQEYVKKSIAQPLGIRIHFLQTAEERADFTQTVSLCYNKAGKEVEDPLGTMLPAGSNTYMSIIDFVKFGQIFLKKNGTLLKKESLTLMETLECPELLDRELCNGGYGLLHNVYNFGESVGKVWGHGGDTMYHHSTFFYIPGQNIGLVIFANSEQAPAAEGIIENKVLSTYLKEKGIIVDNHSFTYDYIPADGNSHLRKYATGFGVCDIKQNKDGELVTKIKGLPIRLKACKDGFWHLCPNSLLLRLPLIKKEIRKLRVKFVNYAGKEVVVVEQRDENSKVQTIIGCRYEETVIPKTFKNACGQYEIANPNLTSLKGNCELCIKKDVLTLKVKLLGTKACVCLKAAGEHLAFVQGFGRSTGDAVIIKEENGVKYLTWSGLVLKKR